MAKVGCPRKYKSVAAMDEKINAYFEDCKGHPYILDDGTPLMDKYGMPVIIDAHPPTFTGLALWLGFTGRQAMMDYEARPEFSDSIKRARARCEEYAERRLYDRDGTRGAQFSLTCNFGWKNTQAVEVSGGGVVLMPEVKEDGR